MEDGSVMKLWTVNGRFIGHVTCEHMINCLEFSSAPEGISINVIATGLSNGAIRWVHRHRQTQTQTRTEADIDIDTDTDIDRDIDTET